MVVMVEVTKNMWKLGNALQVRCSGDTPQVVVVMNVSSVEL
jgi:hypothetical protein